MGDSEFPDVLRAEGSETILATLARHALSDEQRLPRPLVGGARQSLCVARNLSERGC
jgi:ABC-type thiamine transport system ATPase subunit